MHLSIRETLSVNNGFRLPVGGGLKFNSILRILQKEKH